MKPKGIILSGGPRSVNEDDAPVCDKGIFDLGIPILGHLLRSSAYARFFGGKVEKSPKREYGKAHISIDKKDKFLEGIKDGDIVWMSHQDKVLKMPKGFMTLCRIRTIHPMPQYGTRNGTIYGVQFHPEVHHTPKGKRILKNFLYKICSCKGLFSPKSFIEIATQKIQEEAGDRNCRLRFERRRRLIGRGSPHPQRNREEAPLRLCQ